MKTNLNLVVSVILFFSGVLVASSKEIRYQQVLSGSNIVPSAPLHVNDPEWAMPNTYNDSFSTRVTLRIDDNIPPFFWYQYTVVVQITPILPDNTTGPSYNRTLHVENNRYGGTGNFQDVDIYRDDNALGATVRVLSINAINMETSQPLSVTPNNVSLVLS